MRIKVYIFIALVFISGSACSEQTAQTSYKAEANALCDAFNPETWGVDLQNMNPSQKAATLSKKIQSAIHSEQMKKIYQSLIHDAPNTAYTNYARNVSALIDEPYTCDSIKDYFSISFN